MKSFLPILSLASLIAGLLVSQVGCADSGEGHANAGSAPAAPVPAGMIRGQVLETMNSGGYSYLLIETDTDKRWVATREIVVAAGDVVQTLPGMPMPNFESTTLNRTFDVVYFVGGVENLSASSAPAANPGGAMPEGHPDVPMPPNHPAINGAPAATAPATSVAAVEPGRDIAYVYANKDALAGQQISLRGTVVKYNDGIMGRNWIHIRDGSGDAAAGNHDLTVTTNDTAAVGETVVLTGTVILDKDFGAGYSFPVMMEDASVEAE